MSSVLTPGNISRAKLTSIVSETLSASFNVKTPFSRVFLGLILQIFADRHGRRPNGAALVTPPACAWNLVLPHALMHYFRVPPGICDVRLRPDRKTPSGLHPKTCYFFDLGPARKNADRSALCPLHPDGVLRACDLSACMCVRLVD